MPPKRHTSTRAPIAIKVVALTLAFVAIRAAADPSEVSKSKAEVAARAHETIKRQEDDLCADPPNKRSQTKTVLAGPLCTDLEKMNTKTFADMKFIQQRIHESLDNQIRRQRDIEMFTLQYGSQPTATVEGIKQKLESTRLAIAFSEASIPLANFTSKVATNEHLKDPKLQLLLSKIVKTMNHFENLPSGGAPYSSTTILSYSKHKSLINKAILKQKTSVPKLDNNELSTLQAFLAQFPVQKSALSDLKEAESYLLTQLENLKESTSNSQKFDPETVLHLEAGIKARDVRARLLKYIDCGFSPGEILALSYYTGSGYLALNSALRKNESARTPVDSKIVSTVLPNLNSGLDKLKPYMGIVIRGAVLPADALAEHKNVGNIIEYKSFVSTSLSSGFPKPHMFVIHSKTGRYVAPYSSHYGEAEVLFKPGTKFKVLNIVEEGSVTNFVLDEVVE